MFARRDTERCFLKWTEPGHFDESELVTTLQSLVSILEDPDPDPKRRAYAHTEDATFVMPGVPPVHGREEMLRRLETGEVLWDVTITPYNIDGCQHQDTAPLGVTSKG